MKTVSVTDFVLGSSMGFAMGIIRKGPAMGGPMDS